MLAHLKTWIFKAPRLNLGYSVKNVNKKIKFPARNMSKKNYFQFCFFRLVVFCQWVKKDQTISNGAENSLCYRTGMVYVGFFKKKSFLSCPNFRRTFCGQTFKNFFYTLSLLDWKRQACEKDPSKWFWFLKHIFCLQELEKTHLIGWGQDL